MLFLVVEFNRMILFEETCLKHTWKSVFELACIYNWITPWISVLMD